MRIAELLKNKRWEIVFLSIFLVVGIFFRVYNFAPWLHFEIDQSYDTLVVSPAVEEGIGNLPLLGPTAGGGRALRLGPAFYYLEYASAKIFGNTPAGHAALVLVFSLLSLPLFYAFAGRYFSQPVRIGLLAIYAFSFYLILYARFSWSPNVLLFFSLGLFYALLRSVSAEEKNKDRWFLLAITLTALISQIHFNAFFVVPAVVVAFLLIKRPRFRWHIWLSAVFLCLVIYAPVIVSEVKTHGENTQYFLAKVAKGERGGSVDYNLVKFVQTVHYFSADSFLIVTGLDHINDGNINGYGLEAGEHYFWRILALAILLLQASLFILRLLRETETRKRDFLILCGLWMTMTFLYFFTLSRGGFRLYPRFFLLVAPLAVVLFGLLLEHLSPGTEKKRWPVFIVILAILSLSNVTQVIRYFQGLGQTSKTTFTVQTEDVLPDSARITLEQQNSIVAYIEGKYRENGYPVYMKSIHEYEPSLAYLLERRGVNYYGNFGDGAVYVQGNYFVVKQSKARNDPKIEGYTLVGARYFGTLTVYSMAPVAEAVTQMRQDESTRTLSVQKEQIAKLYTWKKLLSGAKE